MSKKKIWFITLFPNIIDAYFTHGVMSRFRENIGIINPANYSSRGFKGVDSAPFGGGPGMVMRVDVLTSALEKGIFIHYEEPKRDLLVFYTSPDGDKWNNFEAKSLCRHIAENDCNSQDLVFICGRYEGVDQRFIDMFVTRSFSLGDFILSGGELATMAIVDSLLRFAPGVLGNSKSFEEDSFEDNKMDFPKWTRPSSFRGNSVPEVLLSGNHKEIENFNNSQRPEL